MKRAVQLGIALVAVVVLLPLSAQNPATSVKDKFGAVQVERFEVESGVNFPADYLLTLQEEVIKQVQESKLFDEVLRPGEKPAKEDTTVLRMTGKITKFKAGSRAERYITMFGGSTEIFAHLVYLDGASGKQVVTDDVHGIMAGGFMGGESLNVTRDFARRVVTSAKVMVHKRMPDMSNATVANAAEEAAKVDRQSVAFTSHDYPGTQAKLNEKGAAGYRVADFALTGKDSANIAMETSGDAGKYEYRVLHTRLPGTMQKEMNEAAADGYRLCGQTVGQFGGVMTAIMERPSVQAGKPRYSYRVHQTVRVSSAEKDTRNDQAEGFVLAGATHQSNVHLVVLEKETESKTKGE